jgi:hypothetical protein
MQFTNLRLCKMTGDLETLYHLYMTESYIPTNALLCTIMYYSKMSVLKHLKTYQHVSIIIQIIFRELVGSLLKSLTLKDFISFLKLWRLFVVMRQHNVWCVCVAFCVERCAVEVICGNAAA